MRYHARRILTGEWLHRDLPLVEVERVKNLSGGGSISASIPRELNASVLTDGLRLFEDWATMVYAEDDAGTITNHGIVVPQTSYEQSLAKVTCVGVCGYPMGYYFTESRLWGPGGTGDAKDRPDPIKIVRDHWSWIQQQQDSNLGVVLTGATESTERIGDNAEPYRLQWFNLPDLGEEINNLAQSTPFNFMESARWTDSVSKTDVSIEVNIGWPRIGVSRDDLRFAGGENIVGEPLTVSTTDSANAITGIGNGEGTKMVHSTAIKRDGRLRRTRVLTDKTAKQERMDKRVLLYLERLNAGFDITSVTVRDHPNARLSDLNCGDDIRILDYSPTWGPIDRWVRILSITASDDNEEQVTLTTSSSAFFLYSPTEEVQ